MSISRIYHWIKKISFSQVNFCSRAQFIILYLGRVKEILGTEVHQVLNICLHHWCLKTGQGHRGSFGLLSHGSQALVAVNMVYEGICTAVTLGWHSRSIHNSESDLFKTHTPLGVSPWKMHLNSILHILQTPQNPSSEFLGVHVPTLRTIYLDFYHIPIYSYYWRVWNIPFHFAAQI